MENSSEITFITYPGISSNLEIRGELGNKIPNKLVKVEEQVIVKVDNRVQSIRPYRPEIAELPTCLVEIDERTFLQRIKVCTFSVDTSALDCCNKLNDFAVNLGYKVRADVMSFTVGKDKVEEFISNVDSMSRDLASSRRSEHKGFFSVKNLEIIFDDETFDQLFDVVNLLTGSIDHQLVTLVYLGKSINLNELDCLSVDFSIKVSKLCKVEITEQVNKLKYIVGLDYSTLSSDELVTLLNSVSVVYFNNQQLQTIIDLMLNEQSFLKTPKISISNVLSYTNYQPIKISDILKVFNKLKTLNYDKSDIIFDVNTPQLTLETDHYRDGEKTKVKCFCVDVKGNFESHILISESRRTTDQLKIVNYPFVIGQCKFMTEITLRFIN